MSTELERRIRETLAHADPFDGYHTAVLLRAAGELYDTYKAMLATLHGMEARGEIESPNYIGKGPRRWRLRR
jgi:hypothetical protein